MTVADLIDRLKELPKDLKVFYVGENCGGEIEVIYTQPPRPEFDTKNVIVLTENAP